jgi:sulfate transport system substrate-binding protein
MNRRTLLALSTAALPFPRSLAWAAEEPSSLLNVSYDIARELFAQINPLFAASWREAGGGPLEVNMSHGGSSRQARAVIEGLEADVVTLNQVSDVEALVKNGLVAANWQPRLPLHLLPDLPGAPGQPE